MIRLLLIIGLIWAASVVYRRLRLKSARRPPPQSAYGGKMVKCSECGVFLPPREAIEVGGGRHVCAAHRRGAGD